jgi:hypothetical protein
MNRRDMNRMESFAPDRFARALLDPELPPPCALPARRFGVYRNNVVAGLAEALAARFPACRRLLGEECFRAVAVAHVRQFPPRTRLMQEYGEDFAEFLQSFAPLAAYPYLADVARLEYALGRAYHAADAEALPPGTLAALPAAALERATLTLHPSLQLVASRHPVVSIWRANVFDDAPMPETLVGPEDALALRAREHVEAYALSKGGYAFMILLMRGETIGAAIRSGLAHDEKFDLGAILRILLQAGAIVDLHEPATS